MSVPENIVRAIPAVNGGRAAKQCRCCRKGIPVGTGYMQIRYVNEAGELGTQSQANVCTDQQCQDKQLQRCFDLVARNRYNTLIRNQQQLDRESPHISLPNPKVLLCSVFAKAADKVWPHNNPDVTHREHLPAVEFLTQHLKEGFGIEVTWLVSGEVKAVDTIKRKTYIGHPRPPKWFFHNNRYIFVE